MTTNEPKTTATLAATTAVIASASDAAEAGSVDDLVAKIKSTDDNVRGPALQEAGSAGAPAIKPLAVLLTDSNFEVPRSAKRALYRIIRHAGRPGAESEARAVEAELIPLLKSSSASVRREVLRLLSEIGGEDAVAPMAALLTDPEAREDARCAIARLPSVKATAAFKSAFTSAPEDFRFALAESLRQRGEEVTGYPSKKLVPIKQTSVR
jgi:HEAT repeat protein